MNTKSPGLFTVGLALVLLTAYLFFDSVRITTMMNHGFVSHLYRGYSSALDSSSTIIIFMPFFLGMLWYFYDPRQKWALGVMWIGLAAIAVEIMSRFRFYFNMKSTHFFILLIMLAAGMACMLRSYRQKPLTD